MNMVIVGLYSPTGEVVAVHTYTAHQGHSTVGNAVFLWSVLTGAGDLIVFCAPEVLVMWWPLVSVSLCSWCSSPAGLASQCHGTDTQ